MRLKPYNVSEMEAYIRQAAEARGIDPDVAVKVARTEGLGPGIWQSNFRKGGYREPSYGPFQLLVGGPGTGFPKGMGNEFLQETGLHPAEPENAYKAVDYALDRVVQDGWGAWFGAKHAGIVGRHGIRADAKPLGVRGNQPDAVSDDLGAFAAKTEANAGLANIMAGESGIPQGPGIFGMYQALNDMNVTAAPTPPDAKPENPANPTYPDGAVGPLISRDTGRTIPRTVADMLSGALEGSFIPGGPAERALLGDPSEAQTTNARTIAPVTPERVSPMQVASLSPVSNSSAISPSSIDMPAISPVSESLLNVDSLGPHTSKKSMLDGYTKYAASRNEPTGLLNVPGVQVVQPSSVPAVPPTVPQAMAPTPTTQATAPVKAPAVPPVQSLPPLSPAVNVPERPAPQPAQTPSVKTVAGAVPSVAETVNQYGLDPNPEGAAYGISPWGLGIAKVYDNASENVKIAASGPGLFGALNDEFGTNFGLSPGRTAGPLAMALGIGAAAAGLGPFGLAIPAANMLGGSRWAANRMDLVPRNQRQPIEPERKGLFGNVAEKVGGLFGNNDRISFNGPLGRNQSNERDSKLSEAAQREIDRATRGLY
ncbi:hypothetical protein [Roseibium sp. MMSF_3544]|uniref:hypothetical protein n=1 Tax=unclassified Roseibium TaxID=2629323 RepID=UPI00273E0404|nr:hypothetical protein [Roseibium sp. MMSF_3544]